MAAAVFVHVSDIHFGQETDERLLIHDDVKRELIADAAELVRSLPGSVAHGVLVTGDIAHSGIHEEYEVAGKWLDDLARAVGCEIHRIQMVPGNHDLDRKTLSVGGEHILKVIRNGGATEYEKILSNEVDRLALFARFKAYGRFCEGYDCLLDEEGRYSSNLQVQLAPGRSIRFVRMNSALLCSGTENHAKPELLVGGRQFAIKRNPGEEVIVLMHHPLHWLKDSEEAGKYLSTRARVLITGHEHNPKVKVDQVEAGADFMMLAAGATVPFKSNETYTFTYNVLVFDWDAHDDALEVQIHARAWDPEFTRFKKDERIKNEDQPDAHIPSWRLGCPYFRKAHKPEVERPDAVAVPQVALTEAPVLEMISAKTQSAGGEVNVADDDSAYRLLLLRFFRDITEGERLRILVALDAIDSESDESLTPGIERQLFDWLVREGRRGDLEKQVDAILAEKHGGKAK